MPYRRCNAAETPYRRCNANCSGVVKLRTLAPAAAVSTPSGSSTYTHRHIQPSLTQLPINTHMLPELLKKVVERLDASETDSCPARPLNPPTPKPHPPALQARCVTSIAAASS